MTIIDYIRQANLRTGGNMPSVKGMVVHHTGGHYGNRGPAGVSDVLRERGLSVQFFIDRKGKIYRLIPEGKIGYHAGRLEKKSGRSNSNMEGVEIEAMDDDDVLPVQQKAAAALIGHQSRLHKYDPKDPDAVFGHGEGTSRKERDEGMSTVRRIRSGELSTSELPPSEPPSDDTDQAPIELPELSRGSKGDHVLELQRLLAITRDGDFGPVTEQAVRNFQKSQKIKADGIVGPDTWRALKEHPAQQIEESDVALNVDFGWQTNIIASVFGGAADNERSAYDNHFLNDKDMYVSLPFKFQGKRPRVKVANRAGKEMLCTIEDVGPWLIDDPYWIAHTRPIAENSKINRVPLPRGPNRGRIANGAGIDLSPAVARALGVDGLGKVNWCFVYDDVKVAKGGG